MRPAIIKPTALFGLLALVLVVGAIILVRPYTREQPLSLEADNHGPASPADAHMQNEVETPPKEDAEPDARLANGGEIATATESSGVSQREWLLLHKNTLADQIDEYTSLLKSWPTADDETTLQLDKSIRGFIVEAFRQGLEFEILKEELGSALRWQQLSDEIRINEQNEVPILGFEPGWHEIPEDEVLKPVVLYDEVSIENGTHLYVFQNTTVFRDPTYRRLRWDVYAVVTQLDADVWELRLASDAERYVPDGMGRGLFLVDAFSDSLALPRVAMVKGPEGSGHFVRVVQALIDVEKRNWSLRFPIETSSVRYWFYDANTTILEIHTSEPDEDDSFSNRYNLRSMH